MPAPDVKYFRGSIGSALGLQMKLTREGERLFGSYYYQKIGKKIELRGSIDSVNTVNLDEFDASGKQTGNFKGLWTVDDELINIAGNWTKPNRDNKTAFSLHQEPIEFSSAAEITGSQIKETNKKLKYEINVEYPQITGSQNPAAEKFNQAAKILVLREVTEFRAALADLGTEEETETTTGSDLGIGYTVALARDDLISIAFDIGGYYRGAAHPNSFSRVLNYDLRNGKPLLLAALFKPDAKYVQALADYCMKDLKKQSQARDNVLDDSSIQSGAGPDPKNYDSWTIRKRGLGIEFDAYQVGPYVAGPQFVLVPYAALKAVIKTDGPLGAYLK